MLALECPPRIQGSFAEHMMDCLELVFFAATTAPCRAICLRSTTFQTLFVSTVALGMILAFSRPSSSLITRLFSVASDECVIRPKTGSLHHRKWPEQNMLHVTKVNVGTKVPEGISLRGRCATVFPSFRTRFGETFYLLFL